MHAKHRNGPRNGYRSNTMGMGGVAATSRIPPDGSMRGYGMYSSDYRNYNRGGYGSGGHSKQFQPPPKETDIFMEAGKMAAQYLVAKGMLPPNALSGKWQRNSLKNQVGNFQDFRPNEAEEIQSSVGNRPSVHSRLGNAAPDIGPGRGKYSGEYNSVGSRSSIRGGKRTGPFKNYGLEDTRELGRSGSLTEKIRNSLGAESETDASAGHNDYQSTVKDGSEAHNSSPAETAQEFASETQIVSRSEKQNVVEDADGNNNTLSNEKCITSDANSEATKSSDDEAEMGKAQNSYNDLQQKNDEKKEVASSRIVDTLVSEGHVDLVKHCKFLNVPTKARSSLTIKGSKGDPNPIKEYETICRREPLEDSGVHGIDFENSAGNAAAHQNHEYKGFPSDDPILGKEMNFTCSTRSAQRSESFPERSVCKEQSDEGLSGFRRSNSMLMERGEKRTIEFNPDAKEDFKRLRQWVPVQDAQSNNSSPPISSSMGSKLILQESRASQAAHPTPSPDQNSLDISLFQKDHADPCEFMQERQLFPNSFKTCDLNLVGACDHDTDPMLVFPSITQTGTTSLPIDVDLSMGNNANMPSKISKHSVNEKDIEVIDLEKYSANEDKTSGTPYRRGDTVFTDLDGFPNNVHNANGMPDIQDGYGLMISELLGSDNPNCSSVPTDLSSLHNLQNTEGILGDDDSIYMSLGEIPISMLGAWEQPTQDYGKPF